MTYRDRGVVKNATEDLVMNIEMTGDNRAEVKLFATTTFESVSITVRKGDKLIYSSKASLSPENTVIREFVLSDLEDVCVVIRSATDELLLDWKSEPSAMKEMPEAARPA